MNNPAGGSLQIAVVTLFPDLLAAFVRVGMPRKALECGQLRLVTINPRDFTADPHRTVDDRPFGGGPGMVMKAEPLAAAVAEARRLLSVSDQAAEVEMGDRGGSDPVVIYLSPQGRQLDQAWLESAAGVSAGTSPANSSLVLVCGRYEGVDERLLSSLVDLELSVGDYVLSGGEPAAMVLIDGLARLLPGVLGHEESASQDSFGADGLLDYPHYTRPAIWRDQPVPDVLQSGDHGRIARWRREQALYRTASRRPDLLQLARKRGRLSETDESVLAGSAPGTSKQD